MDLMTDSGPVRTRVGHALSIRPRGENPGPAGGWNIDVFLDGQKMIWQAVDIHLQDEEFATVTLTLAVDSMEVDAEVIPRLQALVRQDTA